MKHYEKQYEDVYTSSRRLSFVKLENIEIEGMSTQKYIDMFSSCLKSSYIDIFNMIVRLEWLKRKFSYTSVRGHSYSGKKPEHIVWQSTFNVFVRNCVGISPRYLSRSFLINKVHMYFKDFYPNFDDNNPFENPELYKFPYEHISLDFLAIVYQMEERIELLKIAEERKLSYNQFMDYVINYVYSLNAESPSDRYTLIMSTTCAPYVRDNKKKSNKKMAKENKII